MERVIELQIDLPENQVKSIDSIVKIIRQQYTCEMTYHNHELHTLFMKQIAPLLEIAAS